MGKNRQDLSHLTKESKAMLALTDEERIIHIQADKWIGYPVAKKSAVETGGTYQFAQQATYAKLADNWTDKQR